MLASQGLSNFQKCCLSGFTRQRPDIPVRKFDSEKRFKKINKERRCCHMTTPNILPEKKEKILAVSHDGVFHGDDVFAAAMLQIHYGKEKVEFVRTRKQEIMTGADVVFDVGEGPLDHHQKGGAGTRENGVPYASAGLIWKQIGQELAGSQKAADLVDKNLIQTIDGLDCGYKGFTTNTYTVYNMVFDMNPTWSEDQDFDGRFALAVDTARSILIRTIETARAQAEGEEIIAQAMKNSPVGLILLDRFVPWQDFVVSNSDATYVLFPGSDGSWRIQGVPAEAGSFKLRKQLPEAWAGKRNADLDAVTGVQGGVFCHISRFMAGHSTKEGAIKLAEIALAG